MRGNEEMAILHLGSTEVEPMSVALHAVPGVRMVEIDGLDGFASIRFDPTMADLGDLVRAVEDAGGSVASVAHRRER